MRRSAALAGVVLAVTGCTRGGPPAGGPQPPPGAPMSSRGGSADPPLPPPPSSQVSYGPGATETPSAAASRAPEPSQRPPNEPAPTAAGPLDRAALPDPVGPFRGVEGAPTEGEFNPNGTWVHAVDGPVASFQAMPQCGPDDPGPAARFALAGTYADPAGVPGHGLALEFATEQQAQTWFATFTRRLGACPRTPGGALRVTDLDAGVDRFSARREVAFDNTRWSEAGRQRGTRVVLVAVGATAAEPRVVAEALSR